MDTASASVSNEAKVQHVTKKSSDELLRKFAEMDSPNAGKNKRRKKRREDECECDSPSNGGTAVVERRSLLPPKVVRRSMLLRQLRVRDGRNKSSLFGTIHKVRPIPFMFMFSIQGMLVIMLIDFYFIFFMTWDCSEILLHENC